MKLKKKKKKSGWKAVVVRELSNNKVLTLLTAKTFKQV